MKEKLKLFLESLKLVWASAPGWATVNASISLIISFLPLVSLYLIKLLIDYITKSYTGAESVEFSRIMLLIIAVVAVYLFDEISTDFGNFVRKKQALKLESYMYDLLHSKSIKLDLINFEKPDYFDLLTRASREAPWRPNSILNNLVSMFRGFLSLLIMAILIAGFNWLLVVLLLLFNVPAIWLRLHYADVIYNFHKRQTPEARKSLYFNWLLTGDKPSRELRLFGLGEYFKSLFRISDTKQKEEELRIIRKRTIIQTISNVFKALAVFGVLLFIARETINKKITLGEMAMFILAFRQGMLYIKDIFYSLAGLYEDSLFVGDVFGFLNLEEKIVAEEPLIIKSGITSDINIRNISFSYPGNNSPAINNISLDLKKGEMIALVGPNGSGKSTLIRLLCRLYDPDTGSISIDGSNIRNIDPVEYKKLFSVVFQDFMLYNLSVGENIRLGNTELKDGQDKISTAARITGVDKLISTFPRGLDTVIGNLFDDSRELSWGEWQKIALARALFRDAPILILDEPTYALDAEAEFGLFSQFREMVKGKTSILITHRFTNIKLADRIVVLEKGSVSESGTHEELMAKKGGYYTMYSRQAGSFN
jgi:ATP-binding cassette, subfamily B, bacterial